MKGGTTAVQGDAAGSGRGPVVLIGFSGAGKTSVAKALHEVLGWKWADIDQEVEERVGRRVEEIIRVDGEQVFRELETEALKAVLERKVDVISAGGGLLTRIAAGKAVNQELLSKACARIVHLAVTEQTSVMRVENEEREAKRKGLNTVRPLLAEGGDLRARVSELMLARKSVYDSAPLKVWTDWLTPVELAQVIERETKRGSKVTVLPFRESESQTEVSCCLVGRGLFEQVGLSVRELFSERARIALISDKTVSQAWGAKARKEFEQLGFQVFSIDVEAGEKSKSLSVLETVCEKLLQAEFVRSDVVVALGGGVVGDLAGLVASLFMRGIGLVQIPSTLVAQVDSSVGGKTGVNLPSGKNSVGTFYPARLVACDLDLLSTLPGREFSAGMAEVVKYGLIASSGFFEWLEENVSKIASRDQECLREIVEFSVRTKLEHVVGDLRDVRGKRALLNFGHTVGHALEKLSGYQSDLSTGGLIHGEAVSIGMIAALSLGERLGVTQTGLTQRAKALLSRLQLPTTIPGELPRVDVAADKWTAALRADKKRVSERMNFVLIQKLGSAKLVEVELKTVLDSLVAGLV